LIKDNNLDKAEGEATPNFGFKFGFGMKTTALSFSLSFFLEALQWPPLLYDPASD
jgi:hypothetical protein